MKITPFTTYAINATIIFDVTPTGRAKYIVGISHNQGTALDRIQICHDYWHDNKGRNIYSKTDCGLAFYDGYDFISYEMQPFNYHSNIIITCRCEQGKLTPVESLKLIKKGMEKAYSKVDSLRKAIK